MNKVPYASSQAEAKSKAKAKTAILLAVIFGGLVVASIAGMLLFDAYGERQARTMGASADAAHQ